MNIIEEAERLLHSEDHRGLHQELHRFLREVAALRGAEAVAEVVENYREGRDSLGEAYREKAGVEIRFLANQPRPPAGTRLYTASPAGSVEVTDAMVGRAARALCEKPPTLIKFDQETETNRAFWRELARTALTAALQEPCDE